MLKFKENCKEKSSNIKSLSENFTTMQRLTIMHWDFFNVRLLKRTILICLMFIDNTGGHFELFNWTGLGMCMYCEWNIFILSIYSDSTGSFISLKQCNAQLDINLSNVYYIYYYVTVMILLCIDYVCIQYFAWACCIV